MNSLRTNSVRNERTKITIDKDKSFRRMAMVDFIIRNALATKDIGDLLTSLRTRDSNLNDQDADVYMAHWEKQIRDSFEECFGRPMFPESESNDQPE